MYDDCMYFDKITFKTKKLFFSASEHARTVLNAFLECMYFDKMTLLIWTPPMVAYMDVAYMDVAYGRLYGRTLLIWTSLMVAYTDVAYMLIFPEFR